MLQVHILTEGFVSPNGRGFLFPIMLNAALVRDLGVNVRIFARAAASLRDCDVLIVDSKVFRRRWSQDADGILRTLDRWRESVAALLYFDTTDSTGWLQVEVLPLVDRYYKNQLLADRTLYLKSRYGHRLFTDHYHRQVGVVDDSPAWSVPVDGPELLGKLRVSWNSGLADYSVMGPARMALYRRLPTRVLLSPRRRFTPPASHRPIDLSCRFGIDYARASIAWQRRNIRRRLAGRATTGRIGRRAYFRELQRSKIVVSPFGWGGLNYRDFEAFLTGGLLLKPDMQHIKTWPDLYRAGETMIAHRWDLEDLEPVIEQYLSDADARETIATRGQDTYRRYVASTGGRGEFAERFHRIVREALA